MIFLIVMLFSKLKLLLLKHTLLLILLYFYTSVILIVGFSAVTELNCYLCLNKRSECFFHCCSQHDTAIHHQPSCGLHQNWSTQSTAGGLEVTYHVFGQKDGSGKVPGVESWIIRTPCRGKCSLLFAVSGDSFKNSPLHVKKSLLSDLISMRL